MTNPVEKYVAELHAVHSTGAGTGELPYYAALAELLNAASLPTSASSIATAR